MSLSVNQSELENSILYSFCLPHFLEHECKNTQPFVMSQYPGTLEVIQCCRVLREGLVASL